MANGGTISPGGAGPLVASGSKVVLVVSRGPGEPARAGAVTAPGVTGKAQGDALEHLQSAGLNAQIVNDYSGTVKRGHVIDQFPEAGQMQAVNSEVVLLISSGPATETARTALPDVVGLREQDAVQRVGQAGLLAEVVHQNHPNVAQGVVFAQLPSQSSVAAVGKKGGGSLVWLWIAIAVVVLAAAGVLAFTAMGKTAPVPNVVGMAQSQAETAITAAGFTVGTVTTTESTSVKAGTVITQKPASGKAKSGSAIQLEVAGKPAPVAVPDVVGLTTAEAEAAIKTAGFVSTQKSDNSASVPKGSVISQKPSAGTKAEAGSTVTITVSKGPQVTNTVTVPELVGMTQDDAVSKVNALGLSSKVTEAHDSTEPTGSVFAQSPDAGVAVAAGSTVKLSVSSGPTP